MALAMKDEMPSPTGFAAIHAVMRILLDGRPPDDAPQTFSLFILPGQGNPVVPHLAFPRARRSFVMTGHAVSEVYELFDVLRRLAPDERPPAAVVDLRDRILSLWSRHVDWKGEEGTMQTSSVGLCPPMLDLQDNRITQARHAYHDGLIDKARAVRLVRLGCIAGLQGSFRTVRALPACMQNLQFAFTTGLDLYQASPQHAPGECQLRADLMQLLAMTSGYAQHIVLCMQMGTNMKGERPPKEQQQQRRRRLRDWTRPGPTRLRLVQTCSDIDHDEAMRKLTLAMQMMTLEAKDVCEDEQPSTRSVFSSHDTQRSAETAGATNDDEIPRAHAPERPSRMAYENDIPQEKLEFLYDIMPEYSLRQLAMLEAVAADSCDNRQRLDRHMPA